jgi:hypothetical protein
MKSELKKQGRSAMVRLKCLPKCILNIPKMKLEMLVPRYVQKGTGNIWIAGFKILMIEKVRSSEMSVKIYQNIRSHVPEDINL